MSRKYYFLIAIIGILTSCGPRNTASIDGTIQNIDADLISFSSPNSIYEFQVDTLGKFNGTIHLEEAQYFSLNFGGRFGNIYLEPGDQLNISFDAQNLAGTLKFNGKGAEENNYLALAVNQQSKLPTYDELIMMSERLFLAQLDSIHKKKLELLNLNASQFNTSFIEREKAKVTYEIANILVLYPDLHRQLTRSEPILTEKFQGRVDSISLEKPELLGLYQFQNFVDARIQLELKNYQDSLKKPVEFFNSALSIADKLITNPKVKAFSYGKSIENYMSTLGYEIAHEKFTSVKDDLRPSQKDAIENKLKSLAKLRKGETAPDFKFTSVYGDSISLSSLQGKYVYISVWDAWSQTYLRETPILNVLQQTYSDSLQIVSVSLDNSAESWRDVVRQLKLPDIQLLASNGWGDKFVSDYMIESLPRFMIIDKKGNIINSLANKPSGGGVLEIRQILNDLPTSD